ncbi:MAG TPA: hypothetical protein VFV40_02120 [Nocardioides sp.]|nr:hypothetical protein [Nocardioides sp.]
MAPAALGAVVAAFSLVAAVSARPDGPDWWVLLLGFQGLALLAWAVLLWTPPPVTGTREDAA